MNMDILDIKHGPVFDETLWEKEFHTHNPYASSKLGNNDEIRIPIQHQDAYTLPCESYIYFEGRVTKKDGSISSNVPFTNNPMAFLFEEIRYEISGIVVDSTKKVGVSSTLKGLVSLCPNETNSLKTAGWILPSSTKIKPSSSGYFDFCVPLRLLLGFAEDYKRIIINVKQELVLLRSSSDLDVIEADNGTTPATLEWKLVLDKVVWRVPHVRLADERRVRLLHMLDSDRDIVIPFRNWEMHEWPILPTNQRQTWAVKTSSNLEKPRYVIFALQTGKRPNITANAGSFDHCNLTNIKLFLNSQFFPYDNLNVMFSKDRYGILYDMYAKFQSSYYGRMNSPLLSPEMFKSLAPIVVIDCSKQNESVKTSTVDIRIEFELEENIPEQTTAYCLVLHDTIVTYTPLTGVVRRML